MFKMFYLCVFQGHQLMFAVTGPEKKKKVFILVVVYYCDNMANSLPEFQNRSGVSPWPTGGWTLKDRGAEGGCV